MIETLVTRNDYVGDDTENAYDFTFKVFSRTDLLVIVTDLDGAETTLTVDVDYVVTGTGDDAGGTVTIQNLDQAFVNTSGYLLDGYGIAIIRNVPLTQTSDIKNQGDYYPEMHEDALDKIVMQVQQVDESISRILRTPVSEAGADLELPTAEERAGTYLAFDADGDPIAASVPTGTTMTSAYIETLLDDANAAAARATLGFSGAGGTVATANLENESVTTAKIEDEAVTTAKADPGFILGMSTVAPEVDDFVAISDTSDSGNNKKVLVSAIKNAAVTASTGATATTASTKILEMSGASATVTLHTAVGNLGQEIEIVHLGTSLTQVYTLATTDGQTIGGIASGSYALYTNSERLRLYSDNVNWKIRGHDTNTDWVSAGAMTIGATTTAPTKATTTENDRVLWRRVGDSVELRYEYSAASNAGAAVGSGDYLFAIPSNMTIDTAKIAAYATTEGDGAHISYNNCGNSYIANGASQSYTGICSVYNATSFRVMGVYDTAAGTGDHVFGSASTGLITIANCSFSFKLTVPISGWRS